MLINVGIIGIGMVGGALRSALLDKSCEVRGYDPAKGFKNFECLVKKSDVIFVCVPTPTSSNTTQDISAVKEVLAMLSKNNFEKTVVIKSTVLPGTTFYLAQEFKLDIVHNPEFLTERNAHLDTLNQPGIMIGGGSGIAQKQTLEVHRLYSDAPAFFYPSASTTEMAKYFHNTFLALKVAFCNEFFDACEGLDLGVNYEDVRFAACAMGKIGPNHTLVPGLEGKRGFGGACFPKDTEAFWSFLDDKKIPCPILLAAMNSNDAVRESSDSNGAI